MTINFHKMHGLGNDFIMVEGINIPYPALTDLAVKLCDRHTGIGADGLINILPSAVADIRMQIINADGSEAEMCGNGIRCFAKLVYEKKIIQKTEFTVETPAGIMVPKLNTDNGKVASVRVDMGAPIDPGSKIISVNSNPLTLFSLTMGVPHAVIFVDEIDASIVIGLGPVIEKNAAFPSGTNVNFVQVIDETTIKMRTWERGAGPTLACGTGGCAAVVASVLNGKTSRNVTVKLAIGELRIEWNYANVFMTGPAEYVFGGKIDLKNNGYNF